MSDRDSFINCATRLPLPTILCTYLTTLLAFSSDGRSRRKECRSLTSRERSLLQLLRLKQSSQEFRSQANEDFTRRQESIEGIVKPVQDSLLRLDKEIREIEKERTSSYSEIKSQIESLSQLEKDLRQETGNLVRALRQPIGRGQWGEVVLETAL